MADTSATFLGPNIYSGSVGTVAVMAAVPANPTRRGLMIINGTSTAAQALTVTFGATLVPVSLTTGLVIVGGNNNTSSTWTSPAFITANLGAQINVIGTSASTLYTVLEFI